MSGLFPFFCRLAGLALLAYGAVTGYAAAIMAGTGLLLAPSVAAAYQDEDREAEDPIHVLREQFATDQLSLEAFEDAVALELAREKRP